MLFTFPYDPFALGGIMIFLLIIPLTFKDKIFNFYNLFQINFVGILKENNFLCSSGKY